MKLSYSIYTCLTLLSAAAVSSEKQGEVDIDLSSLGTNDLSELDYEYEIEVDADCQFTMTTRFSHQDTFSVGTAETCLPGVDAPEDGLPILEGRWRWEGFPRHVREATGLDHLSLDYNPCGHPTGGFLTPHYDLHFYRVTPEYRATKMNCVLLPGTPACLPDGQDTPEGEAFYDVARSASTNKLINMPPGFEIALADAVINMGMHAFDIVNAPESPDLWSDPTYVIVTHDSQIIAVEPMVPFRFVAGDEDVFYETEETYVEQSIPELPYYYSADYDATIHRTTIVMKGMSNLCQAEFEEAAANNQDGLDAQEVKGTSDALSTSTIVTGAMAMAMLGVFIGESW